jgi:hypothetical protein
MNTHDPLSSLLVLVLLALLRRRPRRGTRWPLLRIETAVLIRMTAGRSAPPRRAPKRLPKGRQ